MDAFVKEATEQMLKAAQQDRNAKAEYRWRRPAVSSPFN